MVSQVGSGTHSGSGLQLGLISPSGGGAQGGQISSQCEPSWHEWSRQGSSLTHSAMPARASHTVPGSHVMAAQGSSSTHSGSPPLSMHTCPVGQSYVLHGLSCGGMHLGPWSVSTQSVPSLHTTLSHVGGA